MRLLFSAESVFNRSQLRDHRQPASALHITKSMERPRLTPSGCANYDTVPARISASHAACRVFWKASPPS